MPRSSKMAVAMVSDVCTISGAAMLGRMCRRRIINGGTPKLRAVSTYKSSRVASVDPRASRAKVGRLTIAIVRITLLSAVPNTAGVAVARSTAEKASNTSIELIKAVSTHPPR